jgi:histone H3/H4
VADDARKQLQERFARVGKKALARLHELRPELLGKTLEETVTILKDEERRKRIQIRDVDRPQKTENASADERLVQSLKEMTVIR